jgi:hypothetical protein
VVECQNKEAKEQEKFFFDSLFVVRKGSKLLHDVLQVLFVINEIAREFMVKPDLSVFVSVCVCSTLFNKNAPVVPISI